MNVVVFFLLESNSDSKSHRGVDTFFLVVGLSQRFILLLIFTLENIDFVFAQFTCFLKA